MEIRMRTAEAETPLATGALELGAFAPELRHEAARDAFFAQDEDNYGIFRDLLALSLKVK